MTRWPWFLAALAIPVLGLLVAAPAGPAAACTVEARSYYPGSKFETAPIVVTGRVTNAAGPTLDLVVEETLRGDVPGGVLKLSNLFERADARYGDGAPCEFKNLPGRFKEGERLIVLAPENPSPEKAIPYRQYAAALLEGDLVQRYAEDPNPYGLDVVRAAIEDRGVVPATVVGEEIFRAEAATTLSPTGANSAEEAQVKREDDGSGLARDIAFALAATAVVIAVAAAVLVVRRPRA